MHFLNSTLGVYISVAPVINVEGGKRFVLCCQEEFLLHHLCPSNEQHQCFTGAALTLGLFGSILIRTLLFLVNFF